MITNKLNDRSLTNLLYIVNCLVVLACLVSYGVFSHGLFVNHGSFVSYGVFSHGAFVNHAWLIC